jgi:hypothetical protein
VHLLGLGIVGWFVFRSNEKRGNFAGRQGERRWSFGDLEAQWAAHFRALRCVCLCFLIFLSLISLHRMHEFCQADVATTLEKMPRSNYSSMTSRGVVTCK